MTGQMTPALDREAVRAVLNEWARLLTEQTGVKVPPAYLSSLMVDLAHEGCLALAQAEGRP